ncbi:GNAT family protein [Lapidilactobacillus wuchangensis]|uniref:GNAT family N-acetyltransferase n=1 Tax=Lapidilactobacillus wuchangensis TaxID=2486001 RepID=UPI000F7B8F95|nr:GNAT family N-acetyltransferase [Lapidilactobacillus wuchangensis]
MTVNDPFQQRMQVLNESSELKVLRSANSEEPLHDQQIQQYIVYTDFHHDQRMAKTNSIFVYTPWMNTDSQGRPRTDFQNQLLFDYDGWQKQIHIAVLETLGAASKLAFFDYQNHGLAKLSLQSLIKLAQRLSVKTIDASLSSFDGGDDGQRVIKLFEECGFTANNQDLTKGIATFVYQLED